MHTFLYISLNRNSISYCWPLPWSWTVFLLLAAVSSHPHASKVDHFSHLCGLCISSSSAWLLNVAFPQDLTVCLLSQHILLKQSHSPACLPLALGLMTHQICFSGRALSPEFHIHIPSSLVDSSTVMSHRHFKVNVSLTKPIIFHSKSVLCPTYPCLKTSWNPSLLATSS